MKLCEQCKTAPVPKNRIRLCDKCAHARDMARTKASNQRQSENRPKPPTRYCQCGCGVVVNWPVRWGPECKEEALRQQYKRQLEAANERNRQRKHGPDCQEMVIKTDYAPKKRPKPIMTDAEQAAHDSALDEQLHERCGYGQGAVKHCSPQEIAAMQYRAPAKTMAYATTYASTWD